MSFIQERELKGLELLNPSPIITTYRFVELESIKSEKHFAYVSIEKVLHTKLTIKYHLDSEGNGLYEELI